MLTPDSIMVLIISIFAGAGFAWLALCLLAWGERVLRDATSR